MCGNHDMITENERSAFLAMDQDMLIKKFHIEHDQDYFYFKVFAKDYKLDRENGHITSRDAFAPVPHDVKMLIYNLFSHTPDQTEAAKLSGNWSNLVQLGGMLAAGHVNKLKTPEALKPFYDKVPELKEICKSLGGEEKKGGDVSFVIPVLDFFPIWFQYWDADDEFPANVQFLFDSNALDFYHFEILHHTAVYLKGLLETMLQQM